MFHHSTERLISYWRARKRDAVAPPRAAINPGDFLDLLPQVFILGRERAGLYPVRLVGGFVSDLHGRDLRGEDSLGLWALSRRLEIKGALETARRRAEPLVIDADIRAHGAPTVGLEVMLAPLTGADGLTDRFLGLYQPMAMMQRLRGRPAYELGVRRIQSLGPANEEAPHLRLAALDGRRIA
ncbi:MAG: hypothetical protein JWP92_1477 [Caulobacter sp.]|jgi:hypothetical protein|nr:hypothetical protein [Caulobacter sp.]